MGALQHHICPVDFGCKKKLASRGHLLVHSRWCGFGFSGLCQIEGCLADGGMATVCKSVVTNLTTCDTCFIRKNSRRRYRIFLGDITFGFFSIEVSNHKLKPNMDDGMARSLAEESISFFFPLSSLQHQLECTYIFTYLGFFQYLCY